MVHTSQKEVYKLQKPNARQSQSKNDPLVRERKAMAKREADYEKKVAELSELNENLKRENEAVKKEQQKREVQVEKLTQFWTLAQQKQQQWELRSVELEAKMQRMKVLHVEQASLLHKRISMLQLDTRLEKVATTQTDAFGNDSDCTQQRSAATQTESEWDRARVEEMTKTHDDKLIEVIAEIENAKVQAQSDYKFAMLQMEQTLREEHEDEIRTVKEEKERQLEELTRVQAEQLQLHAAENEETKVQLNAEINANKVEIHSVRADLAAKEEECENLKERIQQVQTQYEDLNAKFKTLSVSYDRNKVHQAAIKKDAKTIQDLRNRLEKIEEINEILLAEYKKMEEDKALQAEALTRINPARLRRPSQMEEPTRTRAEQLGELADQVRRQYGGLHIP